MTRIFVVGSYVQGLTIRVPRLPALGESLVGSGFDSGPGGKGSNQAIAAARLGAHARLLVCLGDDIFGELALQTYAAEGISSQHVLRMPGASSGVGFVNVLPDGENWITVDMGANMLLSPRHVRACAAEIAECDILMTQFEAPPETVAAALALGKEQGALTILNPAPARRADPAMLAHVDVLTPNASEARLLLGLPPADPSSSAELAQRLLGLGVGAVVITKGAAGAFLMTADMQRQVAAVPVAAVDGTGCGDSFNAALALALGEGKSLLAAARFAARAGAYTACHRGVIDGLPTRAQLDNFNPPDSAR